MAFDEVLGDRVRAALSGRSDVSEKRMFGGLAFMVGSNMAVGIVGRDLMVRVGPDAYADALAQPHVRPMDFSGRPMEGFVYVAPEGLSTDAMLDAWVDRGAEFATQLPSKAARPARARRRA
jgi:TfoX/Sxy family transcriptional regulator of competence genes